MDDDADLTPAEEGWVATHEMYKAMRTAGFSMFEAASVIAAIFIHRHDGTTQA